MHVCHMALARMQEMKLVEAWALVGVMSWSAKLTKVRCIHSLSASCANHCTCTSFEGNVD